MRSIEELVNDLSVTFVGYFFWHNCREGGWMSTHPPTPSVSSIFALALITCFVTNDLYPWFDLISIATQSSIYLFAVSHKSTRYSLWIDIMLTTIKIEIECIVIWCYLSANKWIIYQMKWYMDIKSNYLESGRELNREK
jgi:hypothetical protein